MKKLLLLAGVCSLALGLTACKPGAPSAEKAFATASPEVKASWASANAAMTTNGYATAILQLQELRAAPGLTADQQKVIDAKSTAISDQMYAAANKDDPAAKKAIEDLRDSLRR